MVAPLLLGRKLKSSITHPFLRIFSHHDLKNNKNVLMF